MRRKKAKLFLYDTVIRMSVPEDFSVRYAFYSFEYSMWGIHWDILSALARSPRGGRTAVLETAESGTVVTVSRLRLQLVEEVATLDVAHSRDDRFVRHYESSVGAALVL
jgi:hypothetical protein